MKSRNKVLVYLGWKATRSRAFRESDDFFEEFTATLSGIGGIYAKFLQGILLGYAASKGLKIADKQLNVYENNPDPQLSLQDINHLLGEFSGRITITSTIPIGVGSYSAVYAAILDNTQPIIVKILKPGIKDEIRNDLKFLKKLTYLLRIAGIKIIAVDITQFFNSFKKTCLEETNFSFEAKFQDLMHTRYLNHPTIVVPKVYLELSNKYRIIQDRVGGVSAKSLVDMYLNHEVDIVTHCRKLYNTDLVSTVRTLSYELFYSLLSAKTFHGDLHPGNVRILPNDQIAILDFGIKADPYTDSVVPAAINQLVSDSKFLEGDLDLTRIIEAHFRLYMSTIYDSIKSILHHKGIELDTFFKCLIQLMGISTDNLTDEKKREWLNKGPATMLNGLLEGGSERFGLAVHVQDKSTQRAIVTMFGLLKALGLTGEYGLRPVYEMVIPVIERERSELFGGTPILSPDLALENIYGWLEELASKEPVLALKVKRMLLHLSIQVPLNSHSNSDTDKSLE